MHSYQEQLKKQLAEYDAKRSCHDCESILDILWHRYSASAPVDDVQIRAAEAALAPVFRELSVESSNALFDLISNLIPAYQRAAFLEGIGVGFHLSQELAGP